MKRVQPLRYRALAIASVAACFVATACGSASSSSKRTTGSGSGSGSKSAGTVSGVHTVLPLPKLTGQKVVVSLLGGGSYEQALDKDVFKPFEDATGAQVVVDDTCCDKLEPAVRAGQFVGDLVLGQDYGPDLTYSKEGLLTADPRFAEIGKARGIQSGFYQKDLVATDFYAYVLAWNTKYNSHHPTTWAQFFDTKDFTGTRGLFNLPASDLEIAELASGTPPSSVYPINIDNALHKLTELRKGAKVDFWTGGADLQNKLGSGEIAYSLAFSNRIIQGAASGLPLAMTTNQELLVASGACIPKTAHNVNGAIALLDFYLQPSVQAAFAKDGALAPAYASASDLLPPNVRSVQVTAKQNTGSALIVSNSWWAQNNDVATRKFNAWLAGG